MAPAAVLAPSRRRRGSRRSGSRVREKGAHRSVRARLGVVEVREVQVLLVPGDAAGVYGPESGSGKREGGGRGRRPRGRGLAGRGRGGEGRGDGEEEGEGEGEREDGDEDEDEEEAEESRRMKGEGALVSPAALPLSLFFFLRFFFFVRTIFFFI